MRNPKKHRQMVNLIHFSTNKAQNLNTEYKIKAKLNTCNKKQRCRIALWFVMIQAIGSYHIRIKKPTILIASLGEFLDKQGLSNRSNIKFLYHCQTDTMGKHCKQNSKHQYSREYISPAKEHHIPPILSV